MTRATSLQTETRGEERKRRVETSVSSPVLISSSLSHIESILNGCFSTNSPRTIKTTPAKGFSENKPFALVRPLHRFDLQLRPGLPFLSALLTASPPLRTPSCPYASIQQSFQSLLEASANETIMTASAEDSVEVEPGSPPPPPPPRLSHSPSSLEPQLPSLRVEVEEKVMGDMAFGAVVEGGEQRRRKRREHGARMREEDEGIELPKSESFTGEQRACRGWGSVEL